MNEQEQQHPSKQFTISEEEAKALWEELRKAWITQDNQQTIYRLLERLSRELGT